MIADAANGYRVSEGSVFRMQTEIGTLSNAYLRRRHNLPNVCLSLAAVEQFGFDAKVALRSFEDFEGLPHRQQEIVSKGGVLFVDDSISTTPQSAIAALEAYRDRPVTIILGGFDRGIDYTPLAVYLSSHPVAGVVCMGPSGARLFEIARKIPNLFACQVRSIKEAVQIGWRTTPKGGVVLLSPAAPSYGMFKNFHERGVAFAEEARQVG